MKYAEAMSRTRLHLRKSLARTEAEDLAMALKAVADPARLQIIDILKSRPNCEACVCEFTGPLGLSQPTVSHHLKVLSSAGIVHRERRGTWAWFALDTERLSAIASTLHH